MPIFYFFAAIVIWLGILSLRSGINFAAYVRRENAAPLPDFAPFASVIVPCRGREDGLRANLSPLLQQVYPSYELIFVTDRPDDPSLDVVQELIATMVASTNVKARVVIAGVAVDCGQKVHNLRTAVAEIDTPSEVLVFVDTDARPQSDWLRSLIAPLADERIGAATGYRWFIPHGGGFASRLRSVWNASIASALGAREDKNFCWGGSTAIRRSTFNSLKMPERWRGTASDDFALTRALQEAGLPIHFVPACLVPAFDHCTLRELFEFTNRQLKITRVYAPHLWKPLLVGSLLFCAIFFGGIVLLIARAIFRLPLLLTLATLLVIYGLGSAKAYLRLQAVAVPLDPNKKELFKTLPAHLLLWPLASALFLCNAINALLSRRIKWRGITYELKSPVETVIIAREP
ncbi:MAG TPA: glycosyltransferase [Pyrinomonadaceae bacterium]|nr:glycosyltransferase [Pyrinomonadaceae bacterium]